MKHTIRVNMCVDCKKRCEAELQRRGKAMKGTGLDEETSHALVRLLCDVCLKNAGLTREQP